VTDSTLRLRLTNMPYKGAIAANVVLGVVVAAGVPPLAAERVRGAVEAAVASAEGEVTLWARREDGLATVGIRAGGKEWLDRASVVLQAYEPAIIDGELHFSIQRSQLHSV
jgi:hypothetical protein